MCHALDTCPKHLNFVTSRSSVILLGFYINTAVLCLIYGQLQHFIFIVSLTFIFVTNIKLNSINNCFVVIKQIICF
jgi:hypothetical protein